MNAVLDAFLRKLAEKGAEALVDELLERRTRAANESRLRWERLTDEARAVEAAGGVWPPRVRS